MNLKIREYPYKMYVELPGLSFEIGPCSNFQKKQNWCPDFTDCTNHVGEGVTEITTIVYKGEGVSRLCLRGQNPFQFH